MPTDTSPLANKRLIYVAERSGLGGVGDYADDFIAAARPWFGEVVEYRHGAPGTSSALDVFRQRREIRYLLGAGDPENTIVHAELSGGSLVSFWGTWRIGSALATATLHDPPRAVWWPLRTRMLAQHRIAMHGIHFPMDKVWERLERIVVADKTVFVLSEAGAASLRTRSARTAINVSSHLVPKRSQITPVAQRPLAVGMFGHVYRGKGFDLLAKLRELIDGDIAIRVAGRGTQALSPIAGVDILGAVDGPAEDEFFASIRVLLIPYAKRVTYSGEAMPASGTAARAIAYRTPLLVTDYGSLRELCRAGAALGTPLVIDDVIAFAAGVNALARDEDTLTRLAEQSAVVREQRSPETLIADFVEVWAR